jgi:hypothetical protein
MRFWYSITKRKEFLGISAATHSWRWGMHMDWERKFILLNAVPDMNYSIEMYSMKPVVIDSDLNED